MENQELVAELDAVIRRLETDLTDEDKKCGWTLRSQVAMRTFFERLKVDVIDGKDVANVPHYVSLIRGLDHWGIQGGALFRQASKIGFLVSEHVA